MSNLNRKELNDDELNSVNGGVTTDNMSQPGSVLLGANGGEYFTFSISNADESKFNKWAASLYKSNMTIADFDQAVFTALNNPSDPNHPTNFVVTKLENPILQPKN